MQYNNILLPFRNFISQFPIEHQTLLKLFKVLCQLTVKVPIYISTSVWLLLIMLWTVKKRFVVFCDYISLKVMRASLGCVVWHLTGMFWILAGCVVMPMLFVASYWKLLLPQIHIKLLLLFPHLSLLSSPLFSVLASLPLCLPPAFHPVTCSVFHFFQSVYLVFTPSCLLFSLPYCLWCLFKWEIPQPPLDPVLVV